MGTIASSMTDFYRQQTANIKRQSALKDAQIASNNAKLASIKAAIAADNAAYNATHSNSSSTTTNNYNYTGGNQTISNYNGGKIGFNAPYAGVSLSGETLNIRSSSGTLSIGNIKNKLVDFRNSAGNVLAKAYLAGGSGTIDGRNYSGYEFIFGSTAGSNTIYAGSSGSYLWGNSGNAADNLIGGAGSDTFIVGRSNGSDTVSNASSADTVNLHDVRLSDIISASDSNGTISLGFNTGNTLKVQCSDNLSARFTLADGSSWRFNNSKKSWQRA